MAALEAFSVQDSSLYFISHPASTSTSSILHLITTMPLESFYLFYSLPLELRLKIWRLVLPRRTIHIKFLLNAYRPNRTLLPSPVLYNPQESPKEPAPVILNVCQQSRIEAQTLGYHVPSSSVYRTARGQVLSLSLDTIYCEERLLSYRVYHQTNKPDDFYLEHSPLWRLALDADFASSVTSLALPAKGLKFLERRNQFRQYIPLDSVTLNNYMFAALRKFRALKELMLVLDNQMHYSFRREDKGAEDRFVSVSLCDKDKEDTCPPCRRLMSGLVGIDDVNWQVEGAERGPKIRFVVFRKSLPV